MKQTTLPIDWVSGAEAFSDEDSSSSEEEKAGPREAKLFWTRVKSLDEIRRQKVLVYEAQKDLKFDKNVKVIRKEIRNEGGQFIFDPDDFKEQAANFKVEEYRLPEDGLREYARLATKLR